MTNRYVYGVVAGDDAVSLETDAVGGVESIYTIEHGRLGAVVSDIETTEPERSDDDVRRHDDVLREIMDGGERAVVPMQFGMVFDNDRALKNVLRGAAPAFRKALSDVEGCVELGIKLVTTEGATVDREEAEAAVDDELESIARESVEEDLFSDRLLVNRSYLVAGEDREAFDEAVGRLEATFEEDGDLLVQYTGPFAPYSFVDVHVGAQ